VLVRVSLEENVQGDAMQLPIPKLICTVISLQVADGGTRAIKELLQKRVGGRRRLAMGLTFMGLSWF
jgi:hypothetical protein